MSEGKRVIVALDDMDEPSARSLASTLAGEVWGFKGNDLLDDEHSPAELTETFSKFGGFFVDIKGHDIPSTIFNRVKKHAENGASLITLHASGGRAMLREGVKAFDEFKTAGALGILAVTVLTHLSEDECREIYITGIDETIDRFVQFAVDAGVWGIVCSPTDLPRIRAKWGNRLHYVTPGIRPTGSALNDQARPGTPAEAIRNGADLLVIGRPITEADDVLQATQDINAEIDGV